MHALIRLAVTDQVEDTGGKYTLAAAERVTGFPEANGRGTPHRGARGPR